MKGRVLIIAGSDSGGGAGIQGDIKTVTALGGYAASAITALTAQNTKGVFGIMDVPDKFIAQQIELVLSDIGADAIKTGMLHKAGVINVVAKAMAKRKKIPLVVDPVMVAKSGHSLLEDAAVKALKAKLIPLAKIITPNIPEAEALTGIKITSPENLIKAGKKILDLGAENVLVKGGHLPGEKILNVLFTNKKVTVFENDRIKTKHTHGTGCTLASAIATGMAQEMPLDKAVERALKYVKNAVESAPKLGKGQGPLNHMPGITPYNG